MGGGCCSAANTVVVIGKGKGSKLGNSKNSKGNQNKSNVKTSESDGALNERAIGQIEALRHHNSDLSDLMVKRRKAVSIHIDGKKLPLFLQKINAVRETKEYSVRESFVTGKILRYKKLEKMMQGTEGDVWKALDKITGGNVAMKVVKGEHILKQRRGSILKKDRESQHKKEDPLNRVRIEVAILKKLRNPHIVKLLEVIKDELLRKYYLIFEWLDGGPLQSIERGIMEKETRKQGQQPILQHCFLFKPVYVEWQARTYFYQLVQAIQYLHTCGVYHRDIKPENILLTSDLRSVKLTDFGLSQDFSTMNGQEKSKKPEGTAAFMPPEQSGSKCVLDPVVQGMKQDVWMLGVTLYTMLFGILPFNPHPGLHCEAAMTASLYKSINNDQLKFPNDPYTQKVSIEAKDLLMKMLEKKPLKRITLTEMGDHPWTLLNLEKSDRCHVDDVNRMKIDHAESLRSRSVSKSSGFGNRTPSDNPEIGYLNPDGKGIEETARYLRDSFVELANLVSQGGTAYESPPGSKGDVHNLDKEMEGDMEEKAVLYTYGGTASFSDYSNLYDDDDEFSVFSNKAPPSCNVPLGDSLKVNSPSTFPLSKSSVRLSEQDFENAITKVQRHFPEREDELSDSSEYSEEYFPGNGGETEGMGGENRIVMIKRRKKAHSLHSL